MEGLRRGGTLVPLFGLALEPFVSWPTGVAVREEDAVPFCIPKLAEVGVGVRVPALSPAETGVVDLEFDCSKEYSEGEVDRNEPRLSS